MEFLDSIYNKLVEHPTAALLAIALVALGWLAKFHFEREKESRERESALRDAHAKAMAEQFASHLQTTQLVIPVATKLVTCVEILDRLSAAQRGGV